MWYFCHLHLPAVSSETETEPSGKGENNNYLIRPHPEILRAMAERSANRALNSPAPSTSAMGSRSLIEDACSELSFITLHSKENDNSDMWYPWTMTNANCSGEPGQSFLLQAGDQ